MKEKNIPPFRFTQNLMAAITELRDLHDAFVRSVTNEMNALGIVNNVLEVHDALYAVRHSVDPEFTDRSWRPLLPGAVGEGLPTLLADGPPRSKRELPLWCVGP